MVEYVDAVEDLDEEMGEEELAKFKDAFQELEEVCIRPRLSRCSQAKQYGEKKK